MILTVFALLAVIGAAVTVGIGETFILGVLGVFGTFITQWIKTYAGIDSTKALNLTMVISIALAIVGAFISDAFSIDGQWTVGSILQGIIVVFGMSQIAYKYLLSKDAPVPLTPLT